MKGKGQMFDRNQFTRGRKRGRRKGFTLIEVIVVLVILAILAAIAVPALTGYIDKAKSKEYLTLAHDAETAAKTLMLDAYAKNDPFLTRSGELIVGYNEHTSSPQMVYYYPSVEEMEALVGRRFATDDEWFDFCLTGPLTGMDSALGYLNAINGYRLVYVAYDPEDWSYESGVIITNNIAYNSLAGMEAQDGIDLIFGGVGRIAADEGAGKKTWVLAGGEWEAA
jgi:prepilin-type N-terminal cleavage/methylation domain-containing protein